MGIHDSGTAGLKRCNKMGIPFTPIYGVHCVTITVKVHGHHKPLEDHYRTAGPSDTAVMVLMSFHINPLNTKRRLLYLKIQFAPRSKHFPPRL